MMRRGRWAIWIWLVMSVSVCVSAGVVARAEDRIATVLGTGSEQQDQAGVASETSVGNPFGVEVGPDGALYVCEVSHHRIWRFDLVTQAATVVAGNGQRGYSGDGGLATQAQLNEPYELRFDADGNLFFVEMQNHLVRRVDARTQRISTVAGTGQAGFSGDGGSSLQSQFRDPHSLALDDRGYLYVADIGNHRIRRISLASGQIETIAGDGRKELPMDSQPARDRPVLGPRALYVTGRTLWVALREGNSVWQLDLDQMLWRHVAGTGEVGYSGDGQDARRCTFHGPKGLAVDRDGNAWVVDTENQVIRRIDRRTGQISTVAGRGPDHRGFGGDDGPATLGSLNRPHGICVAPDGSLFIGDSENHRVRRVTLSP